jgi:hypothetical protein
LVVQELLRRIDVLPWDRAIAEHYGPLRADLPERPALTIEDWTV